MTQKNPHNGINLLLEIMATLRSPGGCPWDAEQTPESLTPYILEEACELIDAIESGNKDEIMDELGDLLLQVVFQAQIFKENVCFDFNDVANTISAKLIRRHPHVFIEGHTVQDHEELHRQWEEIKSSEKNNRRTCLADHLPTKLPALQRAQKLVSKAHKTGQSDKLPTLEHTFFINTEALDEEGFGYVLLQMAHAAHAAGLDAESALRKTIARITDDRH